MDETPATPQAVSPRRIKRRLILSLLGLHALALVAAVFIIVHGKGTQVKDEDPSSKSLITLDNRDSVGWVTIRGPIFASMSAKPWEQGSEQWAKKIEQLAESKDVKAIVLDINSPGGSVGAVQEIYSRIIRIKKEKKIPFVALFGDVAASGGYYIASACDKIVAHPGTLTGSIGVIFDVTNLEGLFQKIGYKSNPIKSGKHKDIGSPARAMTPEEHEIMQALINDAYGQFVKAVADGRKMPVDTVKPLADGRIYSGNQALDLHLVDQLGDSKDALMLAAKMGGIKDEKPKVRRDTEKLNDLFEMLQSRVQQITLGVGAFNIALPTTLNSPSHGLLYLWSGM